MTSSDINSNHDNHNHSSHSDYSRKPRTFGDRKPAGDRGDRTFRRDDVRSGKPHRPFTPRDGGFKRFDRDGDVRNGERPRRFDRDGERPRFDRDGERPRRFDRDGERPRRFDRDGERPRRFDRDGERPRRFDRDGERSGRPEFTYRKRREDGQGFSDSPRGDFHSRRPSPRFHDRDDRRTPFKCFNDRPEDKLPQQDMTADTWEPMDGTRPERPARRRFNDRDFGNAGPKERWGGQRQPATEGEQNDQEQPQAEDNAQERPAQPEREFQERPPRERPVYDVWNPRPKFEPEPEPDLPYARKHRITVFGGSFDPIHNGHLMLAQKLIEKELTDEVLFVPARIQPFKQEGPCATPEQRLEMIRLALEPYPNFSYSDIEIRREDQLSYTYDTMNTLKQVFIDCDLSILIGMDSFRTLPEWHRAAELVQHFQFLIYPRPSVARPTLPALEKFCGLRNAYKLLNSILPDDDFQLSTASSSAIRENQTKHKHVEDMLPEAVAKYIRVNGLYQ